MVDTASKVIENRVRRIAERQKLRLVKIGRRDTRAHDFGHWLVVSRLVALTPKHGTARRGSRDERCEVTVHGPTTLDKIEEWLSVLPAHR
jgi:hypothetical protein